MPMRAFVVGIFLLSVLVWAALIFREQSTSPSSMSQDSQELEFSSKAHPDDMQKSKK